MKPIKLYWWRGDGAHNPRRQNFGDYLSPLMVTLASGRQVEYAPIEQADMLAIGTILKKERKAKRFLLPRKLHIWGSGAGSPEESFSSRHYYHAVRGTMTRSCIEGEVGKHTALGDPGLLVAHYWNDRSRPKKHYPLGVIPHFVDVDTPAIRSLLAIPGARLIDVFAPINEILSAVMTCHNIVSSSLHGLIVSDALGVPNRRLIISGNIKSSHKFADYYSAFGLDEPMPINGNALKGDESPDKLVGEYLPRDVDRVCADLLQAFPQI